MINNLAFSCNKRSAVSKLLQCVSCKMVCSFRLFTFWAVFSFVTLKSDVNPTQNTPEAALHHKFFCHEYPVAFAHLNDTVIEISGASFKKMCAESYLCLKTVELFRLEWTISSNLLLTAGSAASSASLELLKGRNVE